MIVGFTGTRWGMSPQQRLALRELMLDLQPMQFHHGDCEGADAEAHALARERFPGCVVHVHPGPDGDQHRAGCEGDVTHPGKTHFARNRDIVDAADVVIGTPLEDTRQNRGGTWYTLGYATRRGKRTVIIWRDGTVEDSANA